MSEKGGKERRMKDRQRQASTQHWETRRTIQRTTSPGPRIPIPGTNSDATARARGRTRRIIRERLLRGWPKRRRCGRGGHRSVGRRVRRVV